MIRVEALHKTFPDRGETVSAVDDISFEVPDGELYTLLGPSGCGKTTTLRCIAGLERPDSGKITLGDVTVFSADAYVTTYRRDIGMVFQNYAIWPHMSVFENTAFPLRVDGERHSRREVTSLVEEALELVGLGGYEGRMSTQLSGGQQQRLSLARAVVRKPSALLLDEPLSNLDAKLREHMRQEIRILQQRLGITTLFVTHDQTEALAMSDRIAVLRQGKIVQEGTPQEIYTEPQSEFVAAFVGATNLIRGIVAGTEGDKIFVKVGFGSVTVESSGASTTEVGSEVSLAIRPEDLSLLESPPAESRDANVWPVEVTFSSFTGAVTDFRVKTASDDDVVVHTPYRQATTKRQVHLHGAADAWRILPVFDEAER